MGCSGVAAREPEPVCCSAVAAVNLLVEKLTRGGSDVCPAYCSGRTDG